MKQNTGFLGTYFDRDAVLRLELWARMIAWGVLIAYALESAYNAFQSVYSALIGGISPGLVFRLYNAFSHLARGSFVGCAAGGRQNFVDPDGHRR